MLRKTLTFRRAEAAQSPNGDLPPAAAQDSSEPLDVSGAAPSDAPPGPPLAVCEPAPPARGRRITRRRALLAVAAVLLAFGGAAYTQRHTFTAQGADLSRRIIGDENTAKVESWYFRVEDRADRLKYRLVGGETNPFDAVEARVDYFPRPPQRVVPYYPSWVPGSENPGHVPDYIPVLPLQLPKVHQLRESPEAGEGVWTTAGLPRSSAADMLMAKTYLRPDKSRPYASVGVLLLDSRRIRLHMMGGTADPGGDRGVKGPGAIPADQQPNLLVAWNGGFKGPHGGFGMVADGKEYRPLRNGLATICTLADGAIVMGEWGRDISWTDQMTGCRQNAVLLVANGEVSKRVAEGNDTWGYVQVNSSEFITWRSAVGLTKDGNLMVAAGNSLSAETLAKALWAAGAHTAMQLDINSPYVLTSLYFQQADGTLKAEKFMDSMPDSANRFFKTQERDFFYVTLDETRYR